MRVTVRSEEGMCRRTNKWNAFTIYQKKYLNATNRVISKKGFLLLHAFFIVTIQLLQDFSYKTKSLTIFGLTRLH